MSITTTIGDWYRMVDDLVDGPTIVVPLGSSSGDDSLTIAPGRLLHFDFGKRGNEYLRLYFDDMAYFALHVINGDGSRHAG